MISFNKLGQLGRLGNQMFQYSALRGISAHKDYWYSIPSNSFLFDGFKINQTLPNNNKETICCNIFEFDFNFYDNCPDDIDILGFFQSEKYFKHIENEIRKDFTFHDDIFYKCIEYKHNYFSNTKVISIHVRRTDYISDNNFDCLPINYYKNALKIFPYSPVIIHSDDIEWCKTIFVGERFYFSPFSNCFEDLCLMSLSNYHIIANSSYSWWGSYLAKSERTVAPKQWFSGEFLDWDTKDLYRSNWIII